MPLSAKANIDNSKAGDVLQYALEQFVTGDRARFLTLVGVLNGIASDNPKLADDLRAMGRYYSEAAERVSA